MNIQVQETHQRRPVSLEQALIALALATAAILRLLNLGAAPLSDAESALALQAIEIANPVGLRSQVAIGPQPAYLFLTSILFYLFGATNFLARLWPALAGILVVCLPLLFRRQLGRPVALIAAWGLALDPGLVTVSRQAGGAMMALAFPLFAFGLWKNRKAYLAGISAGVGLLSGPTVFLGFSGIGVAWLVWWFGKGRRQSGLEKSAAAENPARPQEPQAVENLKSDPSLRAGLLALALTLLILGTCFLLYPQGLAAWFQSLAVYLEGWSAPSGIQPLTLIFMLIVFQPLALAFAIVGLVRSGLTQSSKSNRSVASFYFLALWLVFDLLAVLVYPARQTADLIWVLLPLWMLAAWELENYLPAGQPSPISLLQAGLIFILFTLFWNTLVSTRMLTPTEGVSPAGVRLVLLAGIFALAGLTTVLIALGWSWEISRNGLVWGVTCASLVYLLSVLWGASQLRANQPVELWSQPPGTSQTDLLQASLQDLSNRQTGMAQEIQILSTVDNPSLRWALRSFKNTRFVSSLPSEELPPIIITLQDQGTPTLTTSYRGQDFPWRIWPAWTGALPEDQIEWLTFRQAPTTAEQIILWARSDIFPGATLETQPGPVIEP